MSKLVKPFKMTPAQKAIELVDTIYDSCLSITFQEAKMLALLVCENIISNGWDLDYWKQVKKDIKQYASR